MSMAAAYRNHGESYRDSLRSAQSASVYSTDSGFSPLDSIIRDYPLVPGASPNAFQFSPDSYGSTPKTPTFSASKYQQHQQPGVPARLQELQYPLRENITVPKPPNLVSDSQAHEHSGSSPLLHTRFRSPTDSISVDPHRPDSAQTDVPPPDNFIDLRESGAYEHIEVPKAQQHNTGFNPYNYGVHGVAPRIGHGVTPLMQFGQGTSPRPTYGKQPVSRLGPVTPNAEVEAEFPNPNPPTVGLAYGQHNKHTTGLVVNGDNNYDRNSWGTQYSEQNLARQTWQTTTSGITNGGDPFSFRHFESPLASAIPAQDPRPNLSAPKLVVHSPPAHDATHYTSNHMYSSDRQQDEQIMEGNGAVDSYAYVPPSPIEAVPQGRVPSKVPVANHYNFSRPMRSEPRVSDASAAPANHMAARGSEYSAMSTSTDAHIPHTISGFPDPPTPDSQAPSSYFPQPQNSGQPTQRAMKRMSVPKTMPNLVYTDDQLSPSPTRRDIVSSNSPRLTAATLPGSPGRPEIGLVPRGLPPIHDRSRSPSPSDGTSGALRFQAPSPLPGPPRSYDVPYSYHVTITDHQYQASGYANGPASSQSEHSSGSHQTRYSHRGTALPPAPREVVALPSSPPPVGPRPGSGLSLYSRYSFYSAGDLPESAAPTPRGWEKNASAERLRREGGASPSGSDSTSTPTGGKSKGKGKGTDDYSGLPYLNVPATSSSGHGPMSATTYQSPGISPQECLLLGISHHEADRLEESAYWFEKAANENGGCGVGMFMWGLSLRHAWGVERDERAAFWWLRRAAECAVQDMERTTQARPEGEDIGDMEKERDRKAVQSELVLAVYEVGQCFFHGWGVETDKKMAVSYFQVAARLGDMDAQLELGFCFAKGKGCKKDLKEAAKWYRAAAAQGASTIGLAWIYKSKYAGLGGDEQFTDTSPPVLPLSKGSTTPSLPSARSSTGKPESRKLKKPPPRSRTPSSSAKSPAPDMVKHFIADSGSGY